MSQAKRKYLGSPVFPFTNSGSINASAQTTFDFSKRAQAYEKYAPFNSITITNDSSQNIKVYVNQNPTNSVFVPAGVIKTFDKKSYPAIWSATVENVGSSAISANEINIEVQKEVIDGQTVVSKVAERVFGFFGRSAV